jgi:hypothetical protein
MGYEAPACRSFPFGDPAGAVGYGEDLEGTQDQLQEALYR